MVLTRTNSLKPQIHLRPQGVRLSSEFLPKAYFSGLDIDPEEADFNTGRKRLSKTFEIWELRMRVDDVSWHAGMVGCASLPGRETPAEASQFIAVVPCDVPSLRTHNPWRPRPRSHGCHRCVNKAEIIFTILDGDKSKDRHAAVDPGFSECELELPSIETLKAAPCGSKPTVTVCVPKTELASRSQPRGNQDRRVCSWDHEVEGADLHGLRRIHALAGGGFALGSFGDGV